MPSTQSRSYYVDRAITRKIVHEGTGLRVRPMTSEGLWLRAKRHAMTVCERTLAANVASPELARAAVELLLILDELEERDQQGTLAL